LIIPQNGIYWPSWFEINCTNLVAYIIYSPCEWNLNNIIIELHEEVYGEWKPCHMNIRVKLTHVEWISSTWWS
jgi:hypothetical protein